MIKLNKGEELLIDILGELSWFGVNKAKLNKMVEKYFIEKNWMEKDGSFRLNKGGNACLQCMEDKGMTQGMA